MKISSKILVYTLAVSAILAFGVIGTLIINSYGGFNTQIKTPLDALYYTITTISTVGYGDIVPTSQLGKLFAIILIISGLTIFATIISMAGGDIMKQNLEKISGSISSAEKRTLKNHVILIGFDTTNAILAEKLRESRISFIIITGDKVLADQLKRKNYKVYVADATLESDLKDFELEKAKSIIIDIRDNSRTVYVVLVAKHLAKNTPIHVVAPTLEVEKHLKSIGIENIINPAGIAAKQIQEMI